MTYTQMLWKAMERIISPMAASFFLVWRNDVLSSYLSCLNEVSMPHLAKYRSLIRFRGISSDVRLVARTSYASSAIRNRTRRNENSQYEMPAFSPFRALPFLFGLSGTKSFLEYEL